MKFAALLPSMFGNQDKGTGGGSSFNMADIMSMMGNMNMNGGFGKKSKAKINKDGLRKLAKRAELQKKQQNKN